MLDNLRAYWRRSKPPRFALHEHRELVTEQFLANNTLNIHKPSTLNPKVAKRSPWQIRKLRRSDFDATPARATGNFHILSGFNRVWGLGLAQLNVL